MTGASNPITLTRNRKYRVCSEFDFYWKVNNDQADGVTAGTDGMLQPGMTPFEITTERGEYLHVVRYRTNGVVTIVEVDNA